MRRILAVLLCLAFVGAACGSDQPTRETSGSALDDVEVTGDDGEQPTLVFDEPFSVEETETRVITEGDGEEIAENMVITFDFVFVNGRDGTVVGSSYESEPIQLEYESSLMPGLYQGLEGVTGGSEVLIAIAPGDGAGANDESGVEEDDTVLFYAEVHEVREALTCDEDATAEGMPTVERDAEGAPIITVPEGEPPTDCIVQTLVTGDGPVVEAGQSISVHYTGVLWADGSTFDSSWERGTPATFSIGTGDVIAAWDEGLVGQTVGSQVLLVVPPEKGYPSGSPDGSISPTDTLVFVVDILNAT